MQLRVLTQESPEKTKLLKEHGFRWCTKHCRYEKTFRNIESLNAAKRDLINEIVQIGLSESSLEDSR